MHIAARQLSSAWIGLALIGVLYLTRGVAVSHVESIRPADVSIAGVGAPPSPSRDSPGWNAKRLLVWVGRWSLRAAWFGLALIGFLHLTRGTAIRHVRGIGADDTPIAVSEPEFPLKATMLTGASLTSGNRVEIALDGDGTYPRLWEDLRSAERSIALQVYYSGLGRMARELGQILGDRAAAGVRVKVLYDAFGTSGIPSAQLDVLRAAGVLVEPFRPIHLSTLHLAQHRSHVRGIIIDDRIAWTGGFGVDDKWFGDGRTNGSWRETNVRFEGPAVQQMQAAFTAAWSEATGILVTGRPTLSPVEGGVRLAGLLYTAPTMGSTAAERFFALSIAGARKTLYITNSYFAPDRAFIDMLGAAAQRGVDVRILTAGPLTDVQVVRSAGRAWYDALLTAGVRIYEWQPTTLHAKTFVVDSEWATIGSMNFDNRSLALNDEATLLVLDRTIGQQMDRVFLDDLRYSEEVTLAGFRQRGGLERIAERGASLIGRLL
jgi:cardiolipin synthase